MFLLCLVPIMHLQYSLCVLSRAHLLIEEIVVVLNYRADHIWRAKQ